MSIDDDTAPDLQFERLLAASSLGAAGAQLLRKRVDPEQADLVRAISRARNALVHHGDRSRLVELGGLLEKAGDSSGAEWCYRVSAALALERLALLHDRYGNQPAAQAWRDRADNVAPSTARATASAKTEVGPPPRAVGPNTRVKGHIPDRSNTSSPACSCGWSSGIDNGFQSFPEHLRTAWPVLVPRRPHEPLDDWRGRVAARLDAAAQQRDELWRKYDLGRPVLPGNATLAPPEDYVAAEELVQVLTWQLEEVDCMDSASHRGSTGFPE